MKRSVAAFLVVMVVLGTVPTFAQPTDPKDGRAVAMEQADDNAIFNRIGDWFATRGKSAEEAQAIRAQRQAERATAREQREAAQQNRERAREAAQQKRERAREVERAQQEMRGRSGR